MRRMIIILGILLMVGLTAEAQSVRSTSTRGYSSRGYHGKTYGRSHVSFRAHGHVRYGWGSVGVRVGYGGYYGSVSHWPAPAPAYGYYNPYPRVRVGCGSYPVHPGSRFVHYGPRPVSVVAVPIQEVVPVEVPAPARDGEILIRMGDEVVARLQPGEAVITPDGLVLENNDGELVVHRGEQQEER